MFQERTNVENCYAARTAQVIMLLWYDDPSVRTSQMNDDIIIIRTVIWINNNYSWNSIFITKSIVAISNRPRISITILQMLLQYDLVWSLLKSRLRQYHNISISTLVLDVSPCQGTSGIGITAVLSQITMRIRKPCSTCKVLFETVSLSHINPKLIQIIS